MMRLVDFSAYDPNSPHRLGIAALSSHIEQCSGPPALLVALVDSLRASTDEHWEEAWKRGESKIPTCSIACPGFVAYDAAATRLEQLLSTANENPQWAEMDALITLVDAYHCEEHLSISSELEAKGKR